MSTKKTRQVLSKLAESAGTSTRSRRQAGRAALEALDFPELKGATRKAKSTLKAKLIDITRRKAGKRETLEAMEQALGQTRAQVEAVYETAIGRYLQLVELGDAADAEQNARFVYAGPIDGKTRPFCLDHVGRVFRRRDIDDLDNGEGSDVFISRGGWRCRHIWREAPPEQARRRPRAFVSTQARQRVQAVKREQRRRQ